MPHAFVAPTALSLRRTHVAHVHARGRSRRVVTQPRRTARVSQVSMGRYDDEYEPAVGFTMYAELLNGRAAMIGFMAALIIEIATGNGIVPKILELTGSQ